VNASVTGPPYPTAVSVLPSQLLTVQVLRRPVESAQYSSLAFGRRLRDSGIVASMGSVGDCYEHSVEDHVVRVGSPV
jgi:hypothetical protein